MRRFSAFQLISLSAAALLPMTFASEASACGGFFCSQTPIDQTAERIIFEVVPPNVTAHIQIAFAGDRDDFAWIVPVPAVPTIAVDVLSDLAFQGLDVATQPQYSSSSCFFGAVPGAAMPTAAPPPTVDTADDGVTVIDQQTVGPFETVTLQGNSADELITWLQTNAFRITDAMSPFIQPYVDDQMLFVALKLTADAGIDSVTPLSLTYAAAEPVIPLGITSVAAQPEMGVKAFIVGNQRYAPSNWVDLIIPDALIEFDPFGFRNNYQTVVSREVDRVGGLAFVTEYAQPTSDLLTQLAGSFNPTPEAETASQQLMTILSRHSQITRLYTRLSPEEMSETSLAGGLDPGFNVAESQSAVSRFHDLTQLSEPDACTQPPEPDPCAFTYCGRMGYCVNTMNTATSTMEAACVCASEAVARPTTTNPDQLAAAYCEPMALNLDVAPAAGAQVANPCASFSCGNEGECVVFNSNPVCRCSVGTGAIARVQFGAVDPVTFIQPMTTTLSCEPVATDDSLLPQLPPIATSMSGPGTMVAPGMDLPDLVPPNVNPDPVNPDPIDPEPATSEPTAVPEPTAPAAPGSTAESPGMRALSSGGCALAMPEAVGNDSRSALLVGLLGLAAALSARRRRG